MIYRFVFITIIILSLCSLYLGALSPFVRGGAYIDATRSLSSINTVSEFEDQFDRSLTFPSPIGKEEIVKFLGNDILSLVSRSDQSEAVARELTQFIEPHLFKNDVRHLLVGGQLHFVLWENYGGDKNDLIVAERYFEEALAIGPKLPPILFTAREFYRTSDQREKLDEVNATILRYWPNAFDETAS